MFTIQRPQFRYHFVCKNIRLVNICFADDLMLFYKGHKPTIHFTIKASYHFSKAFGLTANIHKSQAYIIGMQKENIETILHLTVFTPGTFPIKYLGVPLSPNKWSVAECHILAEKITNKIKC